MECELLFISSTSVGSEDLTIAIYFQETSLRLIRRPGLYWELLDAYDEKLAIQRSLSAPPESSQPKIGADEERQNESNAKKKKRFFTKRIVICLTALVVALDIAVVVFFR